MSEAKLNPGSHEARKRGCTCPVMDNAHGKGIPWPRKDGLDPQLHPSFYVSEDCPMHGKVDSVCEEAR